MLDARTVSGLLYGLQSRFLFLTRCWFIGIEREAQGLGPLNPGEKHPDTVTGPAAGLCDRFLSEFFFAWLVQIETIAREMDGGNVRLHRFDDALTYISGQSIYDLFAGGLVRGPYLLPWDNASAFRDRVLRPVARLMRASEHDESLKLPPEAVKLLESRGLTFT